MDRGDEACALGLRGEAEKVSVAIVEGTKTVPRLISRQTLEAPVGSSLPNVLASLRSQVLDIIKHHEVRRVGIRLPESTLQGANKEGNRNRMRVDGMLLELAGTLRLEVVFGPLVTLAKALDESDRKRPVTSNEYRGLDLAKVPTPMREAIAAALAALPGSD